MGMTRLLIPSKQMPRPVGIIVLLAISEYIIQDRKVSLDCVVLLLNTAGSNTRNVIYVQGVQ